MSMTCSLLSISPFMFPYSQISRHSKNKEQTTTTSSDFVEQNGLLIRLTAAAGGPLTLHPCLYHMLRLCHNRIKPHFSTQFECGHMSPLPSSVLFIRTNERTMIIQPDRNGAVLNYTLPVREGAKPRRRRTNLELHWQVQ